MVFDTVGGPNLSNSIAAAALNGNVSTTVSLLELDLTPMHFRGLSLHVIFMQIPMLHDPKREAHGAIRAKLAELVVSGALKPLLTSNSLNWLELETLTRAWPVARQLARWW